MTPTSRTPAAVTTGARRRWARSRRASAVAVIVTVLGFGGAVAGVYTGVTLGTRIAPSVADGPREGGPRGDDVTGGGAGGPSSSTTADDDGSLPDRVEGGSTRTVDPTTTAGGDGSAGGSDVVGADPVEPYPGLWPYVSWTEVLDHAARGDDRYRTPDDTAMRFASDVVGLTGAWVGDVSEDGVLATVEIRSGRGSTFVNLTHATPGPSSAATPWSVVDASGGITLDTPTSLSGAAVWAKTSGRPGVVGVHDRGRWRGIGVAPAPGAPFQVRVDPGPGGPAIAVAVTGDPREPASFTVRRIQLPPSSGAAAPVAPADPLEATRALVAAVDQGDVGATWELLDPAARRSVLDWRGLAGRIPALRDQLSRFASGTFTTTSVTTPAGAVSVVAPEVATEGFESSEALAALAFRVDGGARLASTDAGSVDWTGPSDDDPSVLAGGSSRPMALVVDGAVWSSAPEGATGLRASTEGLASGAHLAIAVTVQGEQITASAYLFVVADAPMTDDPPAAPQVDSPPAPTMADPPPTTTTAPAAAAEGTSTARG